MRFLRMRPAVWAMISCSFSSFTRKVAFGSSSVTTPGNSKSSSFAIRVQLSGKIGAEATGTKAFSQLPYRARLDLMETETRSSFLSWSHFLRKTGVHFSGKCSGDRIRIAQFLEENAVDLATLCDVIGRHGLRQGWQAFSHRTGIADPCDVQATS